jgi:hypothetical protein
MKAFRNRSVALALALAALALSACDVDVHERGKDKNVDVRTALGDISVRTTEGGPDTGLPVYPGAQPLRDEDEEPENADIRLATSYFGLHVAAAKYESKDAPRAILDFYKDKMSSYGTVVECKGDIEFEGEPEQPVCKEDSASSEIQLVAGESEENHRIVAVKPRGGGSEFAVVHIQIDKRS